MTTATALLASGLGSLRRMGLFLAAAGVAIGLLLAAHPAFPGAHTIDGGSLLRIDATTPADAVPAP